MCAWLFVCCPYVKQYTWLEAVAALRACTASGMGRRGSHVFAAPSPLSAFAQMGEKLTEKEVTSMVEEVRAFAFAHIRH